MKEHGASGSSGGRWLVVLLPAPAESTGECHGKGSTRAQIAIPGRRQRMPRLISLRTLALMVVPSCLPEPLQLGWEVRGWLRVSRLL